MVNSNRLKIELFFTDKSNVDKVFGYCKKLGFPATIVEDAIQTVAMNCILFKNEIPDDNLHLMNYIMRSIRKELWLMSEKMRRLGIVFTNSELKVTSLMKSRDFQNEFSLRIWKAIKCISILFQKNKHKFTDLEIELWELLSSGLEIKEIAPILSKKPGTVSTLKTRLVDKIQQEFKSHLEEIANEYISK